MRKSKLEKQLREDIRKIVPIEKPKFNLEEIIPVNEELKMHRKTSFPLPVLRTLAMVMSLAVVIILGITFSGGFGQQTTTTTTTTTNTTTTQTDTSMTQTTIPNPITDINAKDYALPIITASQLSIGFSALIGTDLSLKLGDGPLLMDDYIDLVNYYMNALETSLSFNQSIVTPLVSDRIEYAYRIQMSSFNILNDSEIYELYYNVTKEDDEVIKMQGIVIWNDSESNFVGEYENESEEQKLTIIAYQSATLGDDYIKTEFEIEDAEQSYQIEVYQAKELISSSNIQIEIEGDESKISVEITDNDTVIQFEIKKELEDDTFEIKVSYEIGNLVTSEDGEMNVRIVYDEILDKYYYFYDVKSDDITKTYQRDRVLNSEPDTEELNFIIL